jgi:hypothetical protein
MTRRRHWYVIDPCAERGGIARFPARCLAALYCAVLGGGRLDYYQPAEPRFRVSR